MVDSDEVALECDTIEAIKSHARSKQENNSQSTYNKCYYNTKR